MAARELHQRLPEEPRESDRATVRQAATGRGPDAGHDANSHLQEGSPVHPVPPYRWGVVSEEEPKVGDPLRLRSGHLDVGFTVIKIEIRDDHELAHRGGDTVPTVSLLDLFL